MRTVKYVKSDGNNFVGINIRLSAHASVSMLDEVMTKNNWVRFARVREGYRKLRKKLAASAPAGRRNDALPKILPARPEQLPKEIRNVRIGQREDSSVSEEFLQAELDSSSNRLD